MNIAVYPAAEQGEGEFDGGSITERKPIGFPGEGGAVKRVGPLFYWAWAFTREEGYIPPHPHQGFEIVTYVIEGTAVHGDSLGTNSTIGPGGAQVMQTGSGVHHEERFIGPDMEGFQIWFEPDLRRSRQQPPTYRQFEHEQFPSEQRDGVSVKYVIGGPSPVVLTTDALMLDLILSPGAEYRQELPAGRSWAVLAIRGSGTIRRADHSAGPVPITHQDFAVIDAAAGEEILLRAAEDEAVRLIVIEVPTQVDYPLYNKR
ncbi:pirin family protein [Paenibacillus mesophilus]|uniref:pirin family protein n=1 Tax=Paenibacillus mesophilus TaxID=2582849 RepID=UPI00110E540A|nr:pirin family protein [Paenibacillus mesophilus]TMV48469.1 pirin family protein [Paenibacillus mesophilus]